MAVFFPAKLGGLGVNFRGQTYHVRVNRGFICSEKKCSGRILVDTDNWVVQAEALVGAGQGGEVQLQPKLGVSGACSSFKGKNTFS